jgi:3-methylcrotonyl-CoA carboxylase alpha subunit
MHDTPVGEVVIPNGMICDDDRLLHDMLLAQVKKQLLIDVHALEVRIDAEDPDKSFVPSTGRLVHLAPPPKSDHELVDTGVEQGDEKFRCVPGEQVSDGAELVDFDGVE